MGGRAAKMYRCGQSVHGPCWNIGDKRLNFQKAITADLKSIVASRSSERRSRFLLEELDTIQAFFYARLRSRRSNTFITHKLGVVCKRETNGPEVEGWRRMELNVWNCLEKLVHIAWEYYLPLSKGKVWEWYRCKDLALRCAPCLWWLRISAFEQSGGRCVGSVRNVLGWELR